MEKNYTCFFISPIGDIGSDIRQHSDDLIEDLIEPALEVLGFHVIRGDEDKQNRQIDVSVTQWVKTADLCVVDISMLDPNKPYNPNVYYEMGMRAESGEPLIILKPDSITPNEVPADIRNQRFVVYNLDDRKVLREAKRQLREYAEDSINGRDERKEPRISLSQLVETLDRVERKIDRLERAGGSKGKVIPPDPGDNEDIRGTSLQEKFMQALLVGNLPMMENCMERLQFQMDKQKFLDTIVKAAAARGSLKAGQLLIENASEFMDGSSSFLSKIQYLGCLVSNLNRTDREDDYIDFIEELCERLKVIGEDEDPSDVVQIYNQLNRLYFGVFGNTDDKKWLTRSIGHLKTALEISEPRNFLHFNMAGCLRHRDEGDDMQKARDHILRCLELDQDKRDPDHLEEACEIFNALGDPRLGDYMSELEEISPTKATLLRFKFANT